MLTGATLGPYRVLAKLGEGGMGEVFRAHDTRLQRDVAIKVLPSSVAGDVDRLARFTREAQVLAALNHPHIAHVYGIEETDGVRAIAMELVEGPTLAERIAEGPLPVREAVQIALQLADALDAAHERGIVHRDLKPANIKLTADGRVKVLDFGLATAAGHPGVSPADRAGASGATMTSPAVMTQAGVILGTAAYMSPEQARGLPVDKRADIWAFGVLLYEMLTARTLFASATVSDTIAEVLKREIDLTALPAETPGSVRRVIARCLERDPKRRLRDIGDAAYAIAEAEDERPAAAPPPRRGISAAIAATALLAAAASGATWMATRPAPTASVVARAVYELPGGALRRTIQRPQIAISPDGRYMASLLARGAGGASALRRLDQLDWTPVAGSEGATGVFFSPDSQWLGFWTAREIRRVAVSGGAPQTVHTLPVAQLTGPDGVSWGEDGNIYFVELGSRIMAVPAAGGVPVTVVDPPQTGATRVVGVETVPGSRALIYVVASAATATSSLVLHRPDEGPDVEIGQGHTPRALPDGRLLFARGNSLFAAPLDLTAGRLTMEAQLVAQDVAVLPPVAQYAVSDTGTLIYIPGQVASDAIASLHRVARDGRAAELPAGKREYSDLRLSPDERRLAVHLSDQHDDVWVVDLARGTETLLTTFAPLEDETPAWSPDGQWIAYSGTAEGLRCVYRRHADGSSDAVTLWQGSAHTHVTDWSPDGKWLVLEVIHAERLGDIYLLDAAGGGDLQPYLVTGFAEQAGRVSPDGRWMAYQSAESGDLEIYLQSFPSPGNKQRVSIDGGVQPVWSRDGRELYFRSATHLMAAALSAGPAVAVERPIALFRDTFLRLRGNGHTGYDVFTDGSFVFVDVPRNQAPGEPPPSLVAVFNWFEELSNALGRTR